MTSINRCPNFVRNRLFSVLLVKNKIMESRTNLLSICCIDLLLSKAHPSQVIRVGRAMGEMAAENLILVLARVLALNSKMAYMEN